MKKTLRLFSLLVLTVMMMCPLTMRADSATPITIGVNTVDDVPAGRPITCIFTATETGYCTIAANYGALMVVLDAADEDNYLGMGTGTVGFRCEKGATYIFAAMNQTSTDFTGFTLTIGITTDVTLDLDFGDYLAIGSFTPTASGYYTFTASEDVAIMVSNNKTGTSVIGYGVTSCSAEMTAGTTYYVGCQATSADTKVTAARNTKPAAVETTALKLGENDINVVTMSLSDMNARYTFTPETSGYYDFKLPSDDLGIYMIIGPENPLSIANALESNSEKIGEMKVKLEKDTEYYLYICNMEKEMTSTLTVSACTMNEKAVMSTDKKTLTFYSDTKDHSAEGTVYDVTGIEDNPEWVGEDENGDLIQEGVTTVVFDKSFASARPRSLEDWFYQFINLTSIQGIEYLNTSEVVSMNCMFERCYALTSLDLSKFDTKKVTDMGNMFYYCKKLQSITFGKSFVTDNVTNMSSMFAGCSALTSLDLSSFNTSKVEDMDYMFYNCSALKSLSLSSFNTSKVEDMKRMFAYCNALTSLDLSSFNTSNVEDMSYMFGTCSSLSSLTIGNFDMSNTEKINDMLCNCTALKTLTIKALPYLADGTFNSQFSGTDVTVNYELNDNSIVCTDDNYLPTATSNPTYTRTVSSDWGTVVLPFAIQSNDDVQLYTMVGVEDGDEAVMAFKKNDDVVAANTPCVFKRKSSSASEVNFTSTSTDINLISTAPISEADGWSMVGTYKEKTDLKNIYYIGSDKFWKADQAITVKPCRAWFSFADLNAKSLRIKVLDDDVTSILSVDANGNVADAPVYNIAGQRVAKTNSGLLIKNGRKFFRK